MTVVGVTRVVLTVAAAIEPDPDPEPSGATRTAGTAVVVAGTDDAAMVGVEKVEEADVVG